MDGCRTFAPAIVPEGRLNLAQDGVLGRDSRDEKSRRDDWNVPGGDSRALPSKNFRD
jgi:hypothetical protein